MDENRKHWRWSWRLAFFILNAAAIAIWFMAYSGLYGEELAISELSPGGVEIDADRVEEIRLEYNHPLNPETIRENAIRLIPPVAGRAELVGTGAIRFVPREALRSATFYTVVPSPEIRGEGGKIPKPELLEFATTRFKFVQAEQTGYDRDSYTVELTFNQPIASSDLQMALKKRFSQTDAHSSDNDRVDVIGSSTGRTQRLRIAESRPGHILLTLPAGLAGKSGPLGLEREERILLEIRNPRLVEANKEPDWAAGLAAIPLTPEVAFTGMTAEWDDGMGHVRVRTTSPLDPAKAAKYVTVSPALTVTFGSTWNGMKIMGDFKPGRQYRISLAAGMPSTNAGDLNREISRTVWFEDLPETLAFTYDGGFLSPAGLLKVPVKSRNLDAFHLNVRRLYASNIVETLLQEYGLEVEEKYAEPEISRRIVTGGVKNQEQETILDLRELVGENTVGVYGLEIAREDRRWHSRDTVVAVSDLGLGIRQGRDKMVTWTTSIRDAVPRQGVKVSVWSNRRQLLAESVSGRDGVADMIVPLLPAGEKAVLVLAEGEKGEFSFVRLDRDNRSRGSEARQGAPYAKGYEVFLSAERGVYRGGETVLLSGLARNAETANVPDLPVELRLLSPDRKVLRSMTTASDALGRITAEVPLGEGCAGGIYSLEARLPGQEDVLGETLFRMADYLPETLSVAMEFEESAEKSGKDAADHQLLIKVSRLAGGETGRLPTTVIASYTGAPFNPKGWERWRFGDSRLAGRRIDRRERETTLATDGSASVEWSDPELSLPAAAVMAVRVEARDASGRAASETLRKTIHPVPFYTGVLPPERSPTAGETTQIFLAAVKADGTPDVGDLDDWSGKLVRIEYDGIMKKRSDGRIGYEWVRREIPEADLSGSWKDGRSEAAITPIGGGSYRLVIESNPGRACVYDFFATGPEASWHDEDPETLTLTLDRESYRVGDEAIVATAAPFAGIALVTVETDEVLSHRIIEFSAGENTFPMAVSGDMRPNAFVGVTLLRPARAEEEWRPHRLSGTAMLRVDNADRRLLVEIEAPESFSPGKPGLATVKVSRDGEGVADAPVVLWAVDMGILSLTNYETPSPWEAFYRTRRSGVGEADMFSRLAPELLSWGRDPSPGGGDYSGLSRRLNPVFANRVRATVIHQATLRTTPDGTVATALPIPEFAGRLRLMAWSAHECAMGAGELEIEVKAPVSATAAWPRFAAPDDAFTIPVTVINRSGGTGTVTIRHESGDNLTIEPASREIELAENQTHVVYFTALCGNPGVATATVTAALGEDTFSDRVEFSVRPPLLFAREAGNFTLDPGETRTVILAPGLMEKNSQVKLIAGGHPLVNLSGSLDYLLSYPYGCAEQTAARLLALVYLPDLLALSRPGQVKSGEVGVLATACIERLESMQSYNGAIKTWPKSGEELFWVSAQALFTLTESRAAGHAIPDSLINNLVSYLESRLETQLSADLLDADGGEAVALACLGMAKAEKVKRSWLLRLEEIAAERRAQKRDLSSAALAFLVEAVATAGDIEAAKDMYERFKPTGSEAGRRLSKTTELGAWLLASMALGLDQSEQAQYADELGLEIKKGFTAWSTKENSLILTASGRYWQKVGPLPEATAFLRRNGVTTSFSTRRGASWDKLSAGTRVDIENPAEGSLRLFWLAEGVPLSGKVRQEDVGLEARRRIFDSAGREVPGPFELNQGEVYEVRLTVTGRADDLVIADLLPGGLEIENASLKGRNLDGEAASNLAVKNVEIRDDRLLVFASVSGSGEYRYLARAVTGGRFTWPALDTSRMYDSATRSVHGAGELIVKDKEAANDR